MDTNKTKIVWIAIIFVLVAWFLSPVLFSFREPVLSISNAPLSFNAPEAYGFIQEFVTQYPHRILGSLESRQSTGYIHDNLEKLGYSISYSHFDTRIASRIQVGRNVLAYKQGTSPEILALVAHLDTARTTVQGAMDNGSGVGVLLELARIFATKPTNRSLLVIFSDGEEWGMLGARDLAESYPERKRISAVLSLDYVAIGDLGAFCLGETGQFEGFTPPWLRQLVRRAAETQGLPVLGPSGFSEYVERALYISWADQGPFLRAGIPAIDLGSESRELLREKETYHSAQDTIGNLKLSSVEKYGRAAECIVRTLDELPGFPRESAEPLRLRDALFLRPGALSALQIISFLPLAVTFWFHWTGYRKQLSAIAVGREFLAILGTVLPMWIICFLIQLARVLRKLPIYSLYPATVKDPILQSPSWGVLACIFGVALFAAVFSWIISIYSFQALPKPNFNVSKLVLLALLLVGVGFALAYNSYWATVFLVLPSWLWALAGSKRSFGGRMMNRILIVSAGITYYAALVVFASRLHLKWNFVWYQVLALSNGLFTKTAYLLATAIIAIGIRFLAIQSHETDALKNAGRK
jgi:hypothetical protein